MKQIICHDVDGKLHKASLNKHFAGYEKKYAIAPEWVDLKK